MVFIFILLSLVIFSTKVDAKSFDYQFIFEDNFINLDFFKVIDVAPTNQPTTAIIPIPIISTSPAKILSFEYKLSKINDLPLDLPLFLATFGQEVIYYADASLADDQLHKVEIDLSLFDQDILGKTPVFYQNNYLSGFELEVKNVVFIGEFSSNTVADPQVIDLSVIREKDQSLTIVFTLQEESKAPHEYELSCLNEKEEIIHSVKLSKNDDFLWSNFSFIRFFANHKNELIFHLNEFNCDGLVNIKTDQQKKSTAISIINVEDL
jgi:hypothetical protein